MAGLPQKIDTSLNPKEYPTGRNIVKIISGTVAPPSVNVENAVHIGEGMLEYFKNAWPEGCYKCWQRETNSPILDNPKCSTWMLPTQCWEHCCLVTPTSICDMFFLMSLHQSHHPSSQMMVQWNLSVTATSIIKYITCDLFSNVF